MIYVGQLPSTKRLGTLIPFFRLRLTEMYSHWSKRYFREFHALCEFKKVKRLTSVLSDNQCLVHKYCFGFLVFHIKIGALTFTSLSQVSLKLCLLSESWYVASKPVCGLTSYKLRSSVLTSSLKLSVLCERLRIRIVISGLLIVNHGFRFR